MSEYNFIMNSFYKNIDLNNSTDDNYFLNNIFKKTDFLTYENFKEYQKTGVLKYEKDEIESIKNSMNKIVNDKSFMLKMNNELFRYKVYMCMDTKKRLEYNGVVECNKFSWNIVNILNIKTGLIFVNKLPKNIVNIKIYPFRISKDYYTNTNPNDEIYLRIKEFDNWGYVGHTSNSEIYNYNCTFATRFSLFSSQPDDSLTTNYYNKRMLINPNYKAPEIEIKKVNEITSLTIEMYDRNGIINFPVEESDYSLSIISLAFKANVRSAGTYLVVTLTGGNTFTNANEVVYLNVTSTQPTQDKAILELLNNPNGIQLLGSLTYFSSSRMNLAYNASTTQIIFIPSLANLVGTLSPVGKLYIDSRRMLINMELECLDI